MSYESDQVRTLHAEGRHIEAEWERMKHQGACKDATEADVASHRLTFFLGALSVWQAIQDAEDGEAMVDDVGAELETFLEDVEAQGHVTLSDRPEGRQLQ